MEIADGRALIDTPPSTEVYVPTPNNPPWNWLVALGVWAVSVLLIVLVPLVFVVPYAASRGVMSTGGEALGAFLKSDPTAVILQLAPLILAHFLTLVVAWFVVTKGNTYDFRETLGWNMDGFRVWHAVVLTALFYGVAIGFTKLFGQVENDFDVIIKSSRAAVFIVAFFATFTAPIVEEVIYRGIVFSAFRKRFGVAVAVIVATLLFTGVHVPQYSFNNTPDYATVLTLLLVSLSLTLLRASTNNLLPCIVLHTIFNGIQSALLIAEPYLRTIAPGVDPVVDPSKSIFIGLFIN